MPGPAVTEDYIKKKATSAIFGAEDNYAELTVPDGLVVTKSHLPLAGRGVYATKYFPKGTIFGPYTGTPLTKMEQECQEESGYGWEIKGRYVFTVDSLRINTVSVYCFFLLF
jgi:hypothetical protein